MVGRCIPRWNSPFLGDMLVFGGADDLQIKVLEDLDMIHQSYQWAVSV